MTVSRSGSSRSDSPSVGPQATPTASSSKAKVSEHESEGASGVWSDGDAGGGVVASDHEVTGTIKSDTAEYIEKATQASVLMGAPTVPKTPILPARKSCSRCLVPPCCFLYVSGFLGLTLTTLGVFLFAMPDTHDSQGRAIPRGTATPGIAMMVVGLVMCGLSVAGAIVKARKNHD